jgi:hypothetical protein
MYRLSTAIQTYAAAKSSAYKKKQQVANEIQASTQCCALTPATRSGQHSNDQQATAVPLS